MQICLGEDFKISEIINFTSKFWEKISYQNEIDNKGNIFES